MTTRGAEVYTTLSVAMDNWMVGGSVRRDGMYMALVPSSMGEMGYGMFKMRCSLVTVVVGIIGLAEIESLDNYGAVGRCEWSSKREEKRTHLDVLLSSAMPNSSIHLYPIPFLSEPNHL